jgi:uncharacterized protein (TIGR02246 family)
MLRRIVPVVGILAASLALESPALRAAQGTLPAAEEQKIRAVIDAYRRAWLANDAEAVLRLFTSDAVLLPHHGVEPVVGIEAARAFWFPKDSPPVKITELEMRVDQVGGACDVAFARGHSRVAWVTGTGADAKTSSNAGTNLTLLRRGADGAWRITHQMWDDPPPQPR